MKSEPEEFSIDDLEARPEQREPWDGVRNYQARNFMRDQMKLKDRILFITRTARSPASTASRRWPAPPTRTSQLLTRRTSTLMPRAIRRTPVVPCGRPLCSENEAPHHPGGAQGRPRPHRISPRASWQSLVHHARHGGAVENDHGSGKAIGVSSRPARCCHERFDHACRLFRLPHGPRRRALHRPGLRLLGPGALYFRLLEG